MQVPFRRLGSADHLVWASLLVYWPDVVPAGPQMRLGSSVRSFRLVFLVDQSLPISWTAQEATVIALVAQPKLSMDLEVTHHGTEYCVVVPCQTTLA